MCYHKLNGALPTAQTTEAFQTALSHGQVTEKEKALREFVLSAYGDVEFSTKQLEKGFGNAAYATIRSFVLKFEKLGLIKSTQYGNRVKYAVRVIKKRGGVGFLPTPPSVKQVGSLSLSFSL